MYKVIIILLAGPLTYLVLEVIYQMRKRENILFCTENIVEVCEYFINNRETLKTNNNCEELCVGNKRIVIGKYAIYYDTKKELREKLAKYSVQLYDYCTQLQIQYGNDVIPELYKEEILNVGREIRRLEMELNN